MKVHARNTLAAALCAALYVPVCVHAQSQNTQPAPATADASGRATDLDKVVVTGFRYSIEKSLDQKRNANAVVEVITAEDVSKFPDKNVADALQRVPGVVITRSGGEGKSVSVRGLAPDLTLTQLNGNYVASSETNDEATRSFNYTLLPANMLSGAELFKTPEARIDEGGIGGTVILRTRRPLEMESNTGFVTLEGTYSDTSKTTDPQLSAMYSWHSDDSRFGFLLGATQQKRTNRSMEVSTEDWNWYTDKVNGVATNPVTDANGRPLDPSIGNWWGQGSAINDQNGNRYSGFFLPTSVNFGVREEERERKGLQLTYQFKPADNLTLTANYFRFELKGDYTLNTLKIPEWNLARFNSDGNWASGRLLNGFTLDRSGTVVTAAEYEKLAGKAYPCNDAEAAAQGKPGGGWGSDDCTVPTPQLTGGYSREKALSQTAGIEMEWQATDLLHIAAKAGRTWSDGGPSMSFRMSAKPRRNVNGAWEAGNTHSAWNLSGTPSMTFASNLQNQLMAGIAEIDTGSTDSSWKETSITQDHFQIDATKSFLSGWLESVQFGAKFSDSSVHRNTGNTYWVCQGADPDDYDKRYQAGCDSTAGIAQPGFFLSSPIGNLAGGFNANVFPGINFPAYIDYLNGRYGQMQSRREPDFVYDVDEQSTGGYFQANFRTQRLRGNFGVRVVKTKQSAASTDAVERFTDYFADNAGGTPMSCTDPAAGALLGSNGGYTCESGFVRLPERLARSKTFALNTLDKSYTDYLPSFNIAWDLTENIVLRGAASKVIARSAFTDIAYPGALNYYSQEYSNDRSAAGGSDLGWRGNGSNKALDPYEATQYDIGVEWYFRPGSVLGLGLFRKNVKNFVVPVVQDTAVTIGGETVTVQDYSTSANGRDGVSQGVEVYAQHTFDFGLGFQANYTYNDTNLAAVELNGEQIASSPLVGSAKNQANLTVFYETPKFLVRASYNRRGEVVGGLHTGLNYYTEPYAQLDLNASYNLTDRFTVSGSVLNVTKEEQRAHLGHDTDARLWTNNYSGRIMYLGLTYKF
ncbi:MULTISPECIES: TonB-dependent receptor [unclassified Lysobacter]|uniref:TonB-dependent receptor n=1 Tax=unclassified Lysobacter TaxID=2635362 RepID=UPI001BE655F0|nr:MULTISPECIES: TonB-dependent receptor [unclassified Lysobacter]MBT2744850.1 TonB-dependent receptor [Lysobacter sp. ISL-42]MBT2752157.1 TonB-dependent receptor [Lysobacter sp. ISL-50]MBT2778654.1 TonB-dependent receptor [Lysobacter sp. ISL-54]MBT2780415.1 TonB-dependent receptor [Lysobacter sp. ISL-52]